MSARLSDFLVQDGALPVETVRTAVARQIVYGGALDTALLEMDALAEATIWTELSHASGLPIPDPDLVQSASPATAGGFDLVRAERCRAVPVGRRGGRLQLLCGEPIEREALREVSAELAVDLDLYVVPEVRLKMVQQMVYGDPVPPRFVRLLGRLLGPESARRWAEDHARPAAANTNATDDDDVPATTVSASTAIALLPGAPPADDTDALCRIALDPHAAGRLAALRALRGRLEQAQVRELAATFRGQADTGAPGRVLAAIVGITELRDRLAVPILIDLVESKDTEVAEAARQALIEVTKQDHGNSRRRWRAWMTAHGEEARTDWLFAGLAHKVAEIRFAASEELWQITGEYFGYHFESPKREREEARKRWHAWWREHSHRGGA